MQLLRIAGVRFSIDDFGTGHSSLAQLSRLPVDELKIDRSFITHARLGSDEATIITSTIGLGHSMGLSVVAEGVEETEAWSLLRQLGCDFAQGYLISKPLAAKDVEPFVRTANQVLPASDSTVLQIQALAQLDGSLARGKSAAGCRLRATRGTRSHAASGRASKLTDSERESSRGPSSPATASRTARLFNAASGVPLMSWNSFSDGSTNSRPVRYSPSFIFSWMCVAAAVRLVGS